VDVEETCLADSRDMGFKEIFSSKITPIFLADFEGQMSYPDILMDRLVGDEICEAERMTTSVLSPFNLSLLFIIHESSSLTQASTLCLACSSSKSSLVEKDIYN
jgi:hypothetical protein